MGENYENDILFDDKSIKRDEIRFDNNKLCKRNFNLLDKYVDYSTTLLILGLFFFPLLMIWFENDDILWNLLLSDLLLLVFNVFYFRFMYLQGLNGGFKYYDKFSMVILPPKKPEKGLLTENTDNIE